MTPPDHTGGTDETTPRDVQKNLDRTKIAIPLFDEMKKPGPPDRVFDVIIDLNLLYEDGREGAADRVKLLVETVVAGDPDPSDVGLDSADAVDLTPQYRYARLRDHQIRTLARIDSVPEDDARPGAIYKIWFDHPVNPLLTESVSTVKADAARIAFDAAGDRIVWAVVDSGIKGDHPHFAKHQNLHIDLEAAYPGDPVFDHKDFTEEDDPLRDGYGHGTHVAGIIAGELDRPTLAKYFRTKAAADENVAQEAEAGDLEAEIAARTDESMRAYVRILDQDEDVVPVERGIERIAGVAPKCRLVSLKVLKADGRGKVSNIIRALGYIQHVNEYGRWLHIHGVNLSVGYEYDAEWFACGQSPLCVEVDRLVRSGVVVVVAAGNTGFGYAQTEFKGSVRAGIDVTINDPGNAEAAVTVGSTHREKPHVYGVSYFSSKGPTGDGRAKPDLVAPGEKIISCAAGSFRESMQEKVDQSSTAEQGDADNFLYVESSGTSMAAPHVSGAMASFLSIRREFLGQPERAKAIFLDTATDLGREKYFQGRGLVDLMRAIQSV